jgi:anion-transporting  ArsA/GET3 family ATPase
MVARAPRKRMYRTMQGRMVDIEKLRSANENVQAVGNMNVNARGDVLGPGGQIATKKEKVIQKYYEQPKGMVSDTPTKGKPMPAPKAETVKTMQKMTPVASKPSSNKTVAPQPKKVETKVEAEPTPVATFKPKTETIEKKGIDAALDGLE